MTCYYLYERQYKQMRNIFILLCKKSPDRHYFNLSIIITLVYHMYIEHELHNLAYKKNGFLYESQFIQGTIREWYEHDTLVKYFRIQGN